LQELPENQRGASDLPGQLQSRLAAYYAAQGRQQVVGSLSPLTGGWASSLYTFTVTDPRLHSVDASTLVLKTYAPNQHRHDHAAREWQALTGLRAASYPVPNAHLLELDSRHLGCPFIIMAYVAGRQLWEAYEPADQPSRDRLTRVFVERLLELHALPPETLTPTVARAHPHAFIEGELAELRRDSARSPHATLAEVVAWLEQRKQAVPCAEPVILHRDYHPWNGARLSSCTRSSVHGPLAARCQMLVCCPQYQSTPSP
jgi:aminoglycoside phosphotransferase (APT) family kinase protein